jgi:hypothetical protein
MKPARSLALAFATLERPQVVQRLILSVREHYPELPIYVADQSRQIEAMAQFYAANGVTVIRMPFDIGVTASRNRLAREIKEDYFILSDDDFVFGPQTSFDDAIAILEADPELGVIGGRLFDFDGETETIRNWELYLEYDARQKILFSIPIYQLAPRAREVGGIRYYLCDAVLNFAVFRRAIFSAGARWDERFKSNGEHEDFYLNLKLNTPFKVGYLPTMVASHHHPEAYRAYRSRLRERNEGWKLFLEKWGLEQHLEYELGVRTTDDIATVVPVDDARARFFVNPNLSLRQIEAKPGSMLIGDFVEIATTGALDQSGAPAAGNGAVGRLLIDPGTSRIVAASAGGPGAGTKFGEAPKGQLAQRYRLEGRSGGEAISFAGEQLYFRYDPVLREDADFLLWYYCVAPRRRAPLAYHRLAATARWTAADGANLVWKSRRMLLDLRPSEFWWPLFLELPVRPRSCRWLRFDLVTDGGPSPDPVCTGFVFNPESAGARTADAHEASHVLALGRLPNDGASPGSPGRPLEEVGRSSPKRQVSPQRSATAFDLSLLRTSELAGLEALYFVGWEELGRSLVSARLPSPKLSAPTALALPGPGWSAQGGRIYGFGTATGFVALAW